VRSCRSDEPQYESCPSVRLSAVCAAWRNHKRLNSKTKRRRKPKIGVNLPQGRSNRCAIFQIIGRKSGLGLRNDCIASRTGAQHVGTGLTYFCLVRYATSASEWLDILCDRRSWQHYMPVVELYQSPTRRFFGQTKTRCPSTYEQSPDTNQSRQYFSRLHVYSFVIVPYC